VCIASRNKYSRIGNDEGFSVYVEATESANRNTLVPYGERHQNVGRLKCKGIVLVGAFKI